MSSPAPTPLPLHAAAPGDVRRALGGDGLWLDVGLVTLRVRSDSSLLAGQIQQVYRHFPFQAQADWADLHLDIMRVPGLRRWLRPQVRLQNDGQIPFDPFPAESPLPLMEWGANWLIGRRCNDVLMLHAGVVERDGIALVMPALPGSGKSTLTAALSVRGWRLLSDEFGALDLATGRLRPVLKPAALKNESIEVIRALGPQAELGPLFQKTRKGTVAHLAPSAQAVRLRHGSVPAGAVLLPRWHAGAATQFLPVDERMAFTTLAFNAFNYSVTGEAGFRQVLTVVRQCPAWQLIYSDLDDAIAQLGQMWPSVVQAHAARSAQAAALAAEDAAL